MFLQLFVGHFNELVFFSFRDLFGEDPAEIAFRVREARISFVSGHSSFSFQVSIIIQCGSGVDFIKVGRTAQIIEIGLSICALHLRRTIMPVKSFSKVRRYALRRAPNFMKSTPDI